MSYRAPVSLSRCLSFRCPVTCLALPTLRSLASRFSLLLRTDLPGLPGAAFGGEGPGSDGSARALGSGVNLLQLSKGAQRSLSFSILSLLGCPPFMGVRGLGWVHMFACDREVGSLWPAHWPAGFSGFLGRALGGGRPGSRVRPLS